MSAGSGELTGTAQRGPGACLCLVILAMVSMSQVLHLPQEQPQSKSKGWQTHGQFYEQTPPRQWANKELVQLEKSDQGKTNRKKDREKPETYASKANTFNSNFEVL